MDSLEFQNLVEKYISERISPEEVKQLRALLQDESYVTELQHIMDQQLANNTAIAADYPELIDRLKNNLTHSISKREENTPVRRLTPIIRWVAAAVVLFLIAGAYLWTSRQPSTQPTAAVKPAVKPDVAPGKQGAILTLTGGKQLVLDDMSNGVVATQGGTKIVLDNGQLTYNVGNANASEIAWNTITTPKGRQFRLVLPDGTQVWLNAASSLRYPTLFTGKQRTVEITGEAYFEVAKNAQMPFHVKLNDQTEVQVLGTHFNINSYSNELSINTTLLEGSVLIKNGSEKAILKPGQQAQVAPGAQKHIKVINAVNVNKVMAWKNGRFDFQDASLKEVMRQLERWYDIEVVYEKGVPELEFMGTMGRDLSLSDVLSGLKLSEVHFRIEEGRKLVVMP